MTSPAQPTNPVFNPSNSGANTASGNSQESGCSFGRRVMNFFTKSHMPSSSREEHSAWKSISSFFKGLYDRVIKLVNYVTKHIGDMLPPYLMKAGTGSVVGFIIGALTPIGPLWGTVGGLLIASGWQLCVECNTDRDKVKTP